MENQQLTPQQAIEILFKVTGEIALKRADSEMVMQALQVLNGLVPQDKPE